MDSYSQYEHAALMRGGYLSRISPVEARIGFCARIAMTERRLGEWDELASHSRVGITPQTGKGCVDSVGKFAAVDSNAMEVRFSRGMYAVSPAFKRRVQDRFSACL
jgi:hypothetical protein